ncbi:MAG TPA: alkaline phosphatase family protein [Candidatus Cybelea sp.]|jgi:phospholipase C
MSWKWLAVLPAAVLALAGCAFGGAPSSLPYMSSDVMMRGLNQSGAGKIKHIIYIVQENRSFDNMFHGYPGANTVSKGKASNGQTIALVPVSLGAHYDIDHSAAAMFAACHAEPGYERGTHCRMDGFNKEIFFNAPTGLKHPQYTYVPAKESKPYFDMAHEGALADNMFQSQLDESFVAHQYIIAAQADWAVDLPDSIYWGCAGGSQDKVPTITEKRTYGPNIPVCFNYTTLGDELDKAKLSWRFYASRYGSYSSGDGGTWSSYEAIKHIFYGPDWKKDVISPNWKFITDVRAGKLANFTWITPVCDDSDHVNCYGGYGPSWVAALVDTVGRSRFWDSTAIFIQWDDWGGLYDHVRPPYKDRDSVGFRVPLVMLSPYIKRDHVSHVEYETASVLRFAEDLWGLPQMAPADRRAASPADDNFDFTEKPLPFIKIQAPLKPKFFMHQFPDDYFAPDYE